MRYSRDNVWKSQIWAKNACNKLDIISYQVTPQYRPKSRDQHTTRLPCMHETRDFVKMQLMNSELYDLVRSEWVWDERSTIHWKTHHDSLVMIHIQVTKVPPWSPNLETLPGSHINPPMYFINLPLPLFPPP